MDAEGDTESRPHDCRECSSRDVSPHCFSHLCSWVRCNVCGAVTGFVMRSGRVFTSSFPKSA